MSIHFLDKDSAIKKLQKITDAPNQLDYCCVFQTIEQKVSLNNFVKFFIGFSFLLITLGLFSLGTHWFQDPGLSKAIILFGVVLGINVWIAKNKKKNKQYTQKVQTIWYGIAQPYLYVVHQISDQDNVQKNDIQQFTTIKAQPDHILIGYKGTYLRLYAPEQELPLLWELLEKIKKEKPI